ncbi:hypothetical protein CONCODRAFT_9148 [Conidiobolus coronatus NRRL 28638]|uniref:Uncharacterized protein n=1 Tax=Conidiobolus coronatus (strain ATCC 28846 / CBS 209.66 / NRRL 28638) TaxID=796925 RepID=A0A137P0I2_CONC2|nr:hypothetical protein CONCODRAFT_9148 [Conidiobolus coronatus NRRL 28638]|eukprot:KXN68555.1 hypothetical protein CONCODRAFT_9148 [Conidiobolus coronatus NRRL 28638]
MCFDKTGTLTEDGLDGLGVHDIKNSLFENLDEGEKDMDSFEKLVEFQSFMAIFPPQIMKTDPSVSEDLAPYSRWCGNDILEAGIHE